MIDRYTRKIGKPYIPIFLTVCNNIGMKNEIRRVKSVTLLKFVKSVVKCKGALTINRILISFDVTLLPISYRND